MDVYLQFHQRLVQGQKERLSLQEQLFAAQKETLDKEYAILMAIIEKLDSLENDFSPREKEKTALLEILQQFGVERIPSPFNQLPDWSETTFSNIKGIRIVKEGYTKNGMLFRKTEVEKEQ